MTDHQKIPTNAGLTTYVLTLLLIGSFLTPGCIPGQRESSNTADQQSGTLHFYVGTYTRDEGWVNGKAQGIYAVSLDDSVADVTLLTKAVNPSYLTMSDNGRNMYAVSELGRENEEGALLSLTKLDDGRWTQKGRYLTGGKSPAHVSIHPSGKRVYVTNYSGGVLKSFLRRPDGSLRTDQEFIHTGSGPHPNQNGSHLHMTLTSPDGRSVYVPDLGADRIWIYGSNASGRLDANKDSLILPAGSGPRHMAIHPDKPLVFILNELNSTVSTAVRNTETGSLRIIDTISTLPETYEGWNAAAAIQLHPDGNRLFTSNRGHNSIAMFSLNEETGLLQLNQVIPSGGDMPRDFSITPDGKSLLIANQNSDNLVLYDLSREQISDSVIAEIEIPTPVRILFPQY